MIHRALFEKKQNQYFENFSFVFAFIIIAFFCWKRRWLDYNHRRVNLPSKKIIFLEWYSHRFWNIFSFYNTPNDR